MSNSNYTSNGSSITVVIVVVLVVIVVMVVLVNHYLGCSWTILLQLLTND